MTKTEFIKKAREFADRNNKMLRDAEWLSPSELNWKDTIQEILRGDKYMIISYCKGDWIEFHIHTIAGYNEETKEWTDGDYAYSLEGALLIYLIMIDSRYIKSRYQLECEEKGEMTYDRLVELATSFKDGLLEDDEEQAMIYFEETCEMTESEMEFFGIEEEDYEREDD